MKAEALKIEAIRDNYARLQKEAARKEEMLRRKAMVRIGTASCGIAAGALKVKEPLKGSRPAPSMPCRGGLHDTATPSRSADQQARLCPFCYGPGRGAAERLVGFSGRRRPRYNMPWPPWSPTMFFSEFPRGVIEEKMILARAGLINPGISRMPLLARPCRPGRRAAAGAGGVLAEIKEANLRGRGAASAGCGAGAGPRAGWAKYVICNADEGDQRWTAASNRIRTR